MNFLSERNQCSVRFGEVVCDRPATNVANQLCNAHYLQKRRGKEFTPVTRKTRSVYGTKPCKFPGCQRYSVSHGYCDTHSWQLKNKGKVDFAYAKQNRRGYALIRDESGNKKCYRCLAWKPEEEFHESSRTLDGLKSWCKPCRAAGSDKVSPEDRAVTKYGKRPGWFEETFNSQGRACATCLSPEPGKKGWAIDHDHSCCKGYGSCGGCVRGILCGRCNLTLGLIKDSKDTLARMISYLTKDFS